MLLANKPGLYIKYKYKLIIIITIVSWFPALFISFLNEDYQILTFHKGEGIISILEVFWQPDVMSPYWRPVTNFFRQLIKLIADLNPLAFKINSLITYVLCTLMVVFAFKKIGLSEMYSLYGGLLFAVLPSHELQLAWISDHSEPLVTIFLLLVLANYLNIYKKEENKKTSVFLTIVFFILAILTKESAFAGIFIPVVVLFLRDNFSKQKIYNSLRDSAIGIIIIAAALTYRFIVVGGTPFSSRHFSYDGILNYLINFFIYIPLSFFPPEFLEKLANDTYLLILIGFLFFLIAFLTIKRIKKSKLENYKIELFGLTWFIIFIIPALPTLMRWYAFTASFGLICLFSAIAEKLIDSSRGKIFFTTSIIIVILTCAVFDFNRMLKWVESGRKVEYALTSLRNFENNLTSDTLYVWCNPDKVEMIPMMKLGFQQTIQYTLKNNVEVYSLLRAELNSFQNSKIDLISISKNGLVFKIHNGRFLLAGGKSTSVFKPEDIHRDFEGINCKISTYLNKENLPQSFAEINFNQKISADHIYFDGKRFIKIDKVIFNP